MTHRMLSRLRKRKMQKKSRAEKEKDVFMLLTVLSVMVLYLVPQHFLRTLLPLVVVLLPFVVYSFYEGMRKRLPFSKWVHLQAGLLAVVLLLSAINGFA